LWRLLRARDAEGVDAMLPKLAPHDVAICARWRADRELDESQAPYGETLLHGAAYFGHTALLAALLRIGAPAAAVGKLSGCSALHAAAAGGHTAACRLLVGAGAHVDASTVSKRTPLHLACARVHGETARALVDLGGGLYGCSPSAEAPIAMLRRIATDEALSLLADLEQRCVPKAGKGERQTKAEVIRGDRHPRFDGIHAAGSASDAEGANSTAAVVSPCSTAAAGPAVSLHEAPKRTSAVRTAVAEMLPHASADDDLLEVGLDSIGALELLERLSAELCPVDASAKLASTLVFEYPTTRLLEEHLDQVVADHARAGRSIVQCEHKSIDFESIDFESMLSDDDDDGDDGKGADDEHDYDEDDGDEE